MSATQFCSGHAATSPHFTMKDGRDLVLLPSVENGMCTECCLPRRCRHCGGSEADAEHASLDALCLAVIGYRCPRKRA